MSNFISKLNTLKSIEPNENWVVETKKKVLSEAPVFAQRKSILQNIIDKKSSLGFNLQNLFQNLSFKKMAVPAFSLAFVLFGGVFILGASKSSLPGEFLYSLKMINEDMTLAIAPGDKKAEIEMEHAGKRLEEIAEISKKTSDVEQQEKIGRLMERFEEKIESANNSLTKIDKSVEKTKIARAINTQSEKYTEVLAKTTEDLPVVIKDEILEEIIIKAIDSSEKIYLTSLAVIAEEEKVIEIVEEVIDDVSEDGQDDSDEDSAEDDGETKGAEDDEEEPVNDDSTDDGDVLGDEDNDSQSDLVDNNSSEGDLGDENIKDVILDEIEEDDSENKEDVEINGDL